MSLGAISDPSPVSRILVIDDDRDTAETTALFMKAFGHDVHIAIDGDQALEIARRHPPEYVLLDLALPGMDGYQVASGLRQLLADTVVIIAISGYGQEEDRRRGRETGIDHHLLKPADLRALLSLLTPEYWAERKCRPAERLGEALPPR
jgi:DNA-binding response OmpR family regulator